LEFRIRKNELPTFLIKKIIMNFFKKLFGINDEQPINLLQKKKRTYVLDSHVNSADNINPEDIMPFLVSDKTAEFNLSGISAPIFYERENIYGRILETYALLDHTKLDADGNPSISQIKTDNDQIIDDVLTKNADKNIEKLEIDLIYWHPSDIKYKFDILSTKVSFFSSEIIMSKKHMNKAHEMLNSRELLVSIPRRGLIFICDSNIQTEQKEKFVQLHSHIVLNNSTKYDLLCEDIFIVKNGEISMVWKLPALSDLLRKN